MVPRNVYDRTVRSKNNSIGLRLLAQIHLLLYTLLMTSNILPPQKSRPLTPSPPPEKRRQGRGRSWKRGLIAGSTGLLLLGGIAVFRLQQGASTSTPTATESARILPVDTLRAELVQGYEVERTYTGEIAALRASELGFERSGQLVEVLVREGDLVFAGQPLAVLDTSNLETQRQQQVAERARAEAQLRELQAGPRQEDIASQQAVLDQEIARLRELEAGPRVETINTARADLKNVEERLQLAQLQARRRERLYRQGAVSREQFDEAATTASALQAESTAAREQLEELRSGTRIEQIDAQAARVAAARSDLQELLNGTRPEQIDAQAAVVQQIDAGIADLDVTIAKSTLTAPFDGIVATRRLDEGTVVNSGQSVIHLIEDVAPEARIGIPAGQVETLEIGRSQRVKLESETYDATISSILPEIDPVTRTQTVVLRLDRAAISRINPGQTVRLDAIKTISAPGYWLPPEALTQGIRGLWTCYVLVPKEDATEPGIYQVQQQSVEIVHQESDRVLVRGTLQPGDRIVAGGIHRLVPGQDVRPTVGAKHLGE